MPALPTVLREALPFVARVNRTCASEACISNWKITFSILLVVESLVFGHVVLLVRAFSCISPSRLLGIMRYGSAIAGGVFLATGLLHVIPEAIHLYEADVRQGPPAVHHGLQEGPVEFPAVFSIILASFYLMLILEHLLIASCQRKTVDEDDNLSFDPDRSESLDIEVFGRSSMNLATAIGTRDDAGEEGQGSNGYISRSFLACLVITVGVGAHSVLESVALGAAPQFADVLNLFIAIAAHRWATSAALGIRYAKAGLASGPVILLVFLFSFIAPIGVGFGFLAVNASPKAQGVFFALGAGTFLYLGSSATLEHDSARHNSALKMYIASAIGASTMIAITGILVSAKIH